MTSENAPSSSRSSNGPWQPPALEEIQALFPQYEIVALLGRGGMGAVYKGWQRSLDRFVAIKILPQGLTDDPQYSERFKQEAKSMAKLAHACIVAVFDAGELANGMLYFVMEFIEGTDVQKMISEQGSLPPAHAMAITAHVCDALQYAHDRGIIHRDIKPANIMVGYDGVVKVADFGLAKQQQEGVSGLTQSGMVMGTLHYMAPESLILGVSVDHRADIYAVGIMLYQMLTGRLPQGLFEMPSQKVPGLDLRYDAVVAKAIREDRDIRYQSAAELRADLDSILTRPVVKVDPAAAQAPAALPTVARPQRPQGYVQRSPQPVPKKSSATGILLVAVLILAAVGFFVFKDKLLPGVAPAPTQSVTAEAPKAEPATSAPSAEETVKKDAASTTPAATTAQPATMPVSVPKTEPVAPKPAAPQTDLEKRVAVLETGFQNAAKAEPEQVFQQSMAALNKSYLAALDRALASATQKGELDDAVALRAEKQRMEKASSVPSLLEESTLVTPVRETVKKLRDTYRATQLQHETTKAKSIAALYEKYDQAIAAIQSDLTKAKQIDEALQLKPVRDQIGQRKAAVLAMKPAAEAAAEPAAGFTNSLGMKFVPVPDTDVLMCIHETRRQDFAAFAKETSHAERAWANSRANGHATSSGYADDHPVVGVTWEQASAFCEWLGKREGREYKLPSDREWSRANGLQEPESTPKSLSGNVPDHYVWGNAWPPPGRAGNFLDVTCWEDMAVPDFAKPDYHDGFPTTAPVMSFPPNSLGIFDLAGNVTEWCTDWYDTDKTEHVSRGSAWYRPVDRGLQNASFREHTKVGFRNNGTGFRVVLKVNTASAVTTPPAVPVAPPLAVTPSTKPADVPAAPVPRPTTTKYGMRFGPEMIFFGTTGKVSVIGKDGQVSDGARALPPPQGVSLTSKVFPGSTVKTGAVGSADMALIGGGSVRLDADSEVRLPQAMSGKPAVESLELLKGRLFVHVDPADLAKTGRASLLVKTPSATLQLRGGKSYAELGAAYETFGVFKGAAELTETKAGGKVMLKDEMTVAVKAGAVSPPQRLTMAQTAFRKVCDQIELVRTESSLLPWDGVMAETLSDLYFFENNNMTNPPGNFLTSEPTSLLPAKASGIVMMIRPNNVPLLKGRTIRYTPRVDLTRVKTEVVAVELGCRSDGIARVAPGLQGQDLKSGQFDITPFSADYVYHSGRLIQMKPGAGSLGEWANTLYPLYSPGSGATLDLIRPSFYLYVLDNDYFVPGRNEYKIEISPLVIITRKQHP